MIVITGTGRCGTGYVAKLLTGAGVDCGHEGVFKFDGWDKAVKRLEETELEADASWLAAPYLDRLNEEDVIVHLVRHPKPTIDSFRRIGFFNPRTWRNHLPYSRFTKDHVIDAWEHTTTKMRAAHFYYVWNRMIEELAPDAIFHRIGDGGKKLLEKLGIEYEGRELFDDKRYNHRDGPINSDVVLPDDLWDPCKTWIKEMAEDYEYEL